MWQGIVAGSVLVVVVILTLWVYGQAKSSRLEVVEARLNVAQQRLDAIQLEIKQLKSQIKKQNTASAILFTRVDNGAKEYVEKTQSINLAKDDKTRDWLNAELPNSVCSHYGVCNDTDGLDESTRFHDSTVPQTEASDDENE